MAAISSAEAPKIVVGLDFGTTFSGIAWALDDDVDDIEVVQEWPGGGNRSSQKVPTILSRDSPKRWGYQVGEETKTVQGFKLLLDESKEIRYLPAAQSQTAIEAMKSTPVRVSGEYLKFLVTHVKDLLSRRFGSSLRAIQVDYILTVPAVWSDKAKDATLQAACLAGIPSSKLFLLSEPEAAAVYAIRTIQPNSMAKGDSLVVCDAGGGTVDLITYRINQAEPLRLEEVTEGTGAICGSVMLDERFRGFLIQKMGHKVYESLSQTSKSVALKHWQDTIKPSYAGPVATDLLDTGYFIPIPGVPDLPKASIHGGFLYMEAKDVKAVFDPIIGEIEKLVTDQMHKAEKLDFSTKAVILVGGLGASEYLFKRLQTRFASIQVMQPRNAWSAVVRGAVHRGLEGNQVENRKSRCHYGVRHSSPFDPKAHDREAAYLCPFEEIWRVDGQMSWFIQKGESITEDRPIKLPFFRWVGLGASLEFKDYLEFCLVERAPNRVTADVSRLCELDTDLSKIPKELFTLCQNSKGVSYYTISFDIVLTPTSASLLFDLEFNGTSYGTVRSRY